MIYLTDVVIDINLCCRIKKGAKYETLKKIYKFKLKKHLISNIIQQYFEIMFHKGSFDICFFRL